MWRRRICLVGRNKTKRIYREVPIAPRLYRILLRAHEAAQAGQVAVCCVLTNNLTRDAAERMKAAGLKPWSKPYQALRSSCENDWKEKGVAEPTYCCWIGHGAKVSRDHYVSPTENEFVSVSGPV